MNANVDLRGLAVRRDGPAPPRNARGGWRLVTRVVVPGVILVGFVAILGWAARDAFLPARAVTVAPVVTTYSEVQSEGTPVFQAAGWIEPRPTPILVTALTEGVVDELLVVEGQSVKAGDLIAHLIQDDAKLALQTAQAERELHRAEVERAKAVLAVTRAGLPSQLQAARSRLTLAQEAYDARKRASEIGAIPYLTLPQAKSELDLAASAVAELEIRQGTFNLEGPSPFAEAAANVKSAVARLKQADTGVALAKLRLDRTVIKAPVDGQVIALVAKRGQRLMGQSPMGHQESSTIVTMFDPALIQVRADVRLEDVPKVQPGQLVKIETPAAPGLLDGEVLQITSQADIQKNTLQVKVAVRSPPPTVRPDMLVQVTFLAPKSPRAADTEKQTLRVLIPKQLVESTDGVTSVWLADLADKVARKRVVKLGRSSGELVEVVQGLNPADRLIIEGRQGLTDGQRITATHAETGKADGKREHSGKH